MTRLEKNHQSPDPTGPEVVITTPEEYDIPRAADMGRRANYDMPETTAKQDDSSDVSREGQNPEPANQAIPPHQEETEESAVLPKGKQQRRNPRQRKATGTSPTRDSAVSEDDSPSDPIMLESPASPGTQMFEADSEQSSRSASPFSPLPPKGRARRATWMEQEPNPDSVRDSAGESISEPPRRASRNKPKESDFPPQQGAEPTDIQETVVDDAEKQPGWEQRRSSEGPRKSNANTQHITDESAAKPKTEKKTKVKRDKRKCKQQKNADAAIQKGEADEVSKPGEDVAQPPKDTAKSKGYEGPGFTTVDLNSTNISEQSTVNTTTTTINNTTNVESKVAEGNSGGK
ncbi:hypothetical protein EV182_000764 [Spiromyces aspiralis]|uniref:Uncharacterized protein n=1 Tax=Spiromyces aspiralis TaxID=68401 RepID=A0ACC1HY57_9FUNG|nr:hypothetical protein EV182_000764 [Spiromyces aspiralis]